MTRRPDMPPLRREQLDPDPIEQFREWFLLAAEQAPLTEAITLATVDADGSPDARMVLLKGFDERGFRFHSNYESEKARQLEAVPRAAIVAYWRELDRQVRIRGSVERLAEAESDHYFASRPRDSRIGAWASPQSKPLADRAELDRRVEQVLERFPEGEIPRPEHWGGYLLRPERIEFWQGQVGRLHDRFGYEREPTGGWAIVRLAP